MNFSNGEILLRLLIGVVFGFAGLWIAHVRGFPRLHGFLLGAFAGPLGLVAAVWLMKTKVGDEQAEQEKLFRYEEELGKKQRACPQCGRFASLTATICPRCSHHFRESVE